MHFEYSCGRSGVIKHRGGSMSGRLKIHNEMKGHENCEVVRRWTFPIREGGKRRTWDKQNLMR